jgi:hypothetical protein
LICAALAVTGAIIWLVAIIPPGEGAFGIAKMVPFLFLFGSIIVFCIVWFPANLGVFLWHRRQHGSPEPKEAVVFSGCVFALCVTTVGMIYISSWHQAHSPQPYVPPPQRQVELKDVKSLIDGFCARDRRGENRGEGFKPGDGIVGTMSQLMYISPPDLIEYTADNLDDNSRFLGVIAGSPNCTPRLFDRFLSIPSTHTSLAANRAAPAQVLEALSDSTNCEVRERVAANRKSPELILKKLATDPNQEVRDSAKRTLDFDGRKE